MEINSRTFKNPEVEYVSSDELKRNVFQYKLAYFAFKVTLFITLFQGVALAIVRTNEPFYRFLLTREFMSWFGIDYKIKGTEANDIRKNLVV